MLIFEDTAELCIYLFQRFGKTQATGMGTKADTVTISPTGKIKWWLLYQKVLRTFSDVIEVYQESYSPTSCLQ